MQAIALQDMESQTSACSTICGNWYHPPRFPLAQRTRVGLLLFKIPPNAFLKMTLSEIFIMQPFHIHKYCRWLNLSCRSNIHKFGWYPTELV